MRRLAVLLTLTLSSVVHAQYVELELPPPPHFAGSPIEIKIEAIGFDEEPQPEVVFPEPEQGTLTALGVSPRISSSISVVNGQVQMTKEVHFLFRYRYVASAPGRVELGPVAVRQGGVERLLDAVPLQIATVPASDRVGVLMRLPEPPLYVGQRAPVTIELWIASDLREKLASYTLRVPLFDQTDDVLFIDEPPDEDGTDLEVETAAGTVRLAAQSRRDTRAGRDYTVIAAQRTLVPLRPGSWTLPPASVVVDEATLLTRDIFGRRRAARTRKLRASDTPRTLKVAALPTEGRPAGFAGGVGRGFALDVSADRSVVQEGDPITLRFTLRGDGSLETAALPPLDGEGLLPPADFSVPDGAVTGVLRDDAKVFTASVRVRHAGVREVPALTYSWFDPEARRYETVYTRPIALSVGEARIVGADSVVRERGEDEPPWPRDEVTDAPGFTLTGADLALERAPERLLRSPGSGPAAGWLPVGLYAGSSLLLLAAFVDRKRRSIPPETLRLRRALTRDLAEIGRASDVGSLASVLRQMRARVPERAGEELDAFLGECDARSYAPSSAARTPDDDFRERALRLARELAEAAA